MIFSLLTSSFGLLGYIGPGGGIALLGPLFGVAVAVLGALAMVAIWPIRFLLKKMRSGANTQSAATEQTAGLETLKETT